MGILLKSYRMKYEREWSIEEREHTLWTARRHYLP
jgi:hypothetical protein